MSTPVDDNDPREWPVEQQMAHIVVYPCDAYDALVALENARMWLTQAARGEVPHGDVREKIDA